MNREAARAMLCEEDRIALDVLQEAVAEALDRKRRLGQYYVASENGKIRLIGEDAPENDVIELERR
jgi:hypothetical protein